MLVKKAVVDSVEGLRDRIFLNISFDPAIKEFIEKLVESEIKDGLQDLRVFFYI